MDKEIRNLLSKWIIYFREQKSLYQTVGKNESLPKFNRTRAQAKSEIFEEMEKAFEEEYQKKEATHDSRINIQKTNRAQRADILLLQLSRR